MANDALRWFLDEMICFRGTLFLSGWAFHPANRVVEMGCLPRGEIYKTLEGYGQESPDVEAALGKAAAKCRFSTKIHVGSDITSFEDLRLVFTLDNGVRFEIDKPIHRRLENDPYYLLQRRFFEMLREKQDGNILELGSRDRRYDLDPFPLLQSSYVRKNLIPHSMRYVGTDIVAAANVDVVGDAHFLSSYFQPQEFDAILSAYVFEHLLMPWKVVIEMNRILKPRGIVMVLTHHTWPLHETPWDFWRFSDTAWSALFNSFTGFRIVQTALGEPGSIVAHLLHPTTRELDLQPAPLMSGVIVEKMSSTKLTWDADPAQILDTKYPK